VLEAGDARVDVGAPTRLRELAVVDHVDAGLGLFAHDVFHGLLQRFVVGLFVHPPLLAGAVEGGNGFGPDQAPGVRGQDPTGTALHVCPLM